MPHPSSKGQAITKAKKGGAGIATHRFIEPTHLQTSGTRVLTLAEAREVLSSQGKSIADFARDHSLDEPTVYQVLSGKKKGLRGEAHRAAVLLGIKAGTLPPNIPSFHHAPLQPGQ